MAAKTVKPCTCSIVAIVSQDGTVKTTGCTATTKRVFAPGHDARLKGFLIRAGIAGDMVSVGTDTNRTPEQVADQFGFGYMVLEGIKRGKDALLAKMLGEVTKAPRARKVPAPRKVTAKVGRWIYEGEVLAAGDGTPVFRYTDKRGNALDTMKFTQI